MKHRSPLVTLAVAVVWFAAMLVANFVANPGQSPSAGAPTGVPTSGQPTGATTAPSSPASSYSPPASSPSESSSSSESATRQDTVFPDRVVYAGRTDDGSLAVAIAVLGDRAAAYLCDGRRQEAWLRGSVDGDKVTLGSRTGYTIDATLRHGKLEGRIGYAERSWKFTIGEAKRPAGIYRGKGKKTTIGWIILPDGSQVGIATTDTDESAAAPKLNPDQGSVKVNGEHVTAQPVQGDTDV